MNSKNMQNNNRERKQRNKRNNFNNKDKNHFAQNDSNHKKATGDNIIDTATNTNTINTINTTNTEDTSNNSAYKHSNTKRYKHVNIKRQRPHITRNSNQEKPQQNVKRYRPRRKRGSATNPEQQCKIIPLGGLDAIGKNMTVLECGDTMVLDDAGLMFPDDNHPGVDLILPDYTYVLEHAHKLKGIVITHGHEDHTGSLPYLLKDLDIPVPIYGSKMTLGLIEGKFAEHHVKNAKLCEIKPGSKITLGCIETTFFSVNHSIPGALGIFFKTPAGNILHTGDFKLDQTPIDGIHTDFSALSRFARAGVDLLMSDSTNAMNKLFTPSESEVGTTLHSIISNATGKVIVASFASHIHRMQQVCDAAIAAGRKVVVTGRSMIQNTDIARKLGYLHISDNDLIDAYELNNMPANKVVVLCTGSQGEPLSALSRIANGEHKTIQLDRGDTVIVSATPVPGNERAVTRVINSLAKLELDVWDKSRAMVHVSGHGGSEELKLMLSIVRPDYFMPVHGEATHLLAHARLAHDVGIPKDHIFVCENGESLVLDSGRVNNGPVYPSGIVYVDGLSVGDTSQEILDERNSLSNQGVCIYSAAINKQRGKICANPKIDMKGIAGSDDPYLLSEVERSAQDALLKSLQQHANRIDIERNTRDAIKSILWKQTKQRPLIVVSILEV